MAAKKKAEEEAKKNMDMADEEQVEIRTISVNLNICWFGQIAGEWGCWGDRWGLKSSLSLDFALNWKHLRTTELISTHATCLSTNQEFQHPEPGTDFYKLLGMDRLWAISRPAIDCKHSTKWKAWRTKLFFFLNIFQNASWRKSVLLDLAAKKTTYKTLQWTVLPKYN